MKCQPEKTNIWNIKKYTKKSSKNKLIQRTDFWLPEVGSKGWAKFLIKEKEKKLFFCSIGMKKHITEEHIQNNLLFK